MEDGVPGPLGVSVLRIVMVHRNVREAALILLHLIVEIIALERVLQVKLATLYVMEVGAPGLPGVVVLVAVKANRSAPEVALSRHHEMEE